MKTKVIKANGIHNVPDGSYVMVIKSGEIIKGRKEKEFKKFCKALSKYADSLGFTCYFPQDALNELIEVVETNSDVKYAICRIGYENPGYSDDVSVWWELTTQEIF